MLKRAMPPAGSHDPVLLILGSLPGDASLAARQYYAHPRNQFWRLLGGAIGEDLAGIDYAQRLERLAGRGIALWDVVSEARRSGSLDGAMREVSANPLADVTAGHRRLQAIAFNGGTASRIGRRALGPTELTLIDLPSSSPAFTRPLGEKAAAWAVLGDVALGRESGRIGR